MTGLWFSADASCFSSVWLQKSEAAQTADGSAAGSDNTELLQVGDRGFIVRDFICVCVFQWLKKEVIADDGQFFLYASLWFFKSAAAK